MKLAHALIAKSIAETIFIASLAVAFYFSSFPPVFRGWGEVQPRAISGWVVDRFSPFDRVEVQLFVDGEFITSSKANLSRPDVVTAGWARDEWHGFSFTMISLRPGPHEARVYALHASANRARQSLQLIGDPIPFSVDESGSLRSDLHE